MAHYVVEWRVCNGHVFRHRSSTGMQCETRINYLRFLCAHDPCIWGKDSTILWDVFSLACKKQYFVRAGWRCLVTNWYWRSTCLQTWREWYYFLIVKPMRGIVWTFFWGSWLDFCLDSYSTRQQHLDDYVDEMIIEKNTLFSSPLVLGIWYHLEEIAERSDVEMTNSEKCAVRDHSGRAPGGHDSKSWKTNLTWQRVHCFKV